MALVGLGVLGIVYAALSLGLRLPRIRSSATPNDSGVEKSQEIMRLFDIVPWSLGGRLPSRLALLWCFVVSRQCRDTLPSAMRHNERHQRATDSLSFSRSVPRVRSLSSRQQATLRSNPTSAAV